MNRSRAVYRQADVPAVIAGHLAVHVRTAAVLLDRYGHPQSFWIRGTTYVTGDEIRAFLARVAAGRPETGSSAGCGQRCGQIPTATSQKMTAG